MVFRGGPATVNLGDPIPLRFYIPRGSVPEVRTFFSYSGNNQMNYTCYLVADPSGDTVPSVPVLLNDPVVTGVPNSLIETPIILGVP